MKVNVTRLTCPISYGRIKATQHHTIMRYIRITQEECMLRLIEEYVIFSQRNLLNLRSKVSY